MLSNVVPAALLSFKPSLDAPIMTTHGHKTLFCKHEDVAYTVWLNSVNLNPSCVQEKKGKSDNYKNDDAERPSLK